MSDEEVQHMLSRGAVCVAWAAAAHWWEGDQGKHFCVPFFRFSCFLVVTLVIFIRMYGTRPLDVGSYVVCVLACRWSRSGLYLAPGEGLGRWRARRVTWIFILNHSLGHLYMPNHAIDWCTLTYQSVLPNGAPHVPHLTSE